MDFEEAKVSIVEFEVDDLKFENQRAKYPEKYADLADVMIVTYDDRKYSMVEN